MLDFNQLNPQIIDYDGSGAFYRRLQPIKLEAVTMLIFLAGVTVFSISVKGGLNRTPARCERYDKEISGNSGRYENTTSRN